MGEVGIPTKKLGVDPVVGVDSVAQVQVSNGLTGKKVSVVSKTVDIAPEGETRFVLYAQKTGPQQGRSSQIVESIDAGSGKKICQIFKPTEDNISNLKIATGISDIFAQDDPFTYANDAALQAAWVPTNGAVVRDLGAGNFISYAMGAKLTVTAAADADITKTIPATDLSLVNSMSVYVKSSLIGAVITLRLSDGVNTSVSSNTTVLTADTWIRIDVDPGSFTGTANLAAITSITVYVAGPAAGEVVHVDEMRFLASFEMDEDFESYADQTALKAEWAYTLISVAQTGEDLDIGNGYNSLKSMRFVSGDNKNVLHKAVRVPDTPPLSLAKFESIVFWYRAIGKPKAFESIKVSIDDGSGAPLPSFEFTPSESNEWTRVRIPFTRFSSAPVLTNFIGLEFEVDSGDGKLDYEFDKIEFVKDAGMVTLELYDFGVTRPVDLASIAAATQVNFDSGLTTEQITVQHERARVLDSGVHVGLDWQIGGSPPTRVRNNLLDTTHYYVFFLSAPNLQAGQRLNVYGSLGVVAQGNFYSAGNACIVDPAAPTVLTFTDVDDCLFFAVDSDVDANVVAMSGLFDSRPGLDAKVFIAVEDKSNETYTQIPVTVAYPLTESDIGNRLELGQFSFPKPKGHPVEVYYIADPDPDETVSKGVFKMTYAAD